MSSRSVFISVVFVSALTLLLSGCATGHDSREKILSRLLGDMDSDISRSTHTSRSDSYVNKRPPAGKRQGYRGSDSPDRPAAGLPSLDDVLGHDTASVDKGVASPDVNVKPGIRASSQMLTTASGLTIQPDSIVQVRVEEDASLNSSYPVNDIGAIDLGYIGPVILLNKSEVAAATKISEVLVAREFRKATVNVKILRASYDKVRISGAVGTPGLIRIGAGDSISLNNALLRAGGIQASAKGAKIRIIRDGLKSAVWHELPGKEYSLMDADGKPAVPDVMLDNNDVVRVFSSEVKAAIAGGDKEILVIGEVNKPGMYRFSSGEPCTIMHLVFKMGGLPPYANKKKIIIKRTGDDGFVEEIEVNAEDILKHGDPEADVQLENGDRVIVPARRISLF